MMWCRGYIHGLLKGLGIVKEAFPSNSVLKV